VELGNLVVNDQWLPDNANQSSPWWELRAMRHVLDTFQKKFINEQIRWFSGNQNTVRIAQYGSRKAAL